MKKVCCHRLLSSCLIVFVFFLAWQRVAGAADASNSPAGLIVYSAMNFIEAEREFAGLQVAIVPYTDGLKVLWRSAGSILLPPQLLDATKDGDSWKVVVPEDDQFPGVWRLRLKGATMMAIGPNGLQFAMKRINLK